MSERVVATYDIETTYPLEAVPLEAAAAAMADEQPTGTFARVLGETDALGAVPGARVERITQTGERRTPALPGAAAPTSAGAEPHCRRAEVALSWPISPCPRPSQRPYLGPRFGIAGSRTLSGVAAGPLNGTIIKPSVGLTPEATAATVREPVARALAEPGGAAAVREAAIAKALVARDAGPSVVVYSALGRDGGFVENRGPDAIAFNRGLGGQLGAILRELVSGERLTHALVAGGDTSGHAARQLGLSALTLAMPLAPGSPLCRGHAPGRALDGLEIALKGGQGSGPAYSSQVPGRRRPNAAPAARPTPQAGAGAGPSLNSGNSLEYQAS